MVLSTLALMLAPACKGGERESQAAQAPKAEGTAADPGAAKKADAPKKPSVRPRFESWRPLLDEAGRAELRAGGLHIDLGTADQHKYTRGGWRTGWGEISPGEISSTQVTDNRFLADVMIDGSVAEVVLRVRSAVAGQTAIVYVDDQAVGNASVGADWSVVRVPVKDGMMAAGRHSLMVRFPKEGQIRAEVDWVWLAEQPGAEPPIADVRAIPLRLGEQPKRALIAPGPRTYSFYLQIPKGASFIFDYGSEAGATFAVRARTDGGEPVELFSQKGSAEWTEAVVDLGSLADKTVRLDLEVTGDAGKSGWGEPAIVIAPEHAPKAAKIDRTTRPKNAIVILIDTQRADSFKAHNPKSQVQTPTYDAWAAKSTTFVNAYNNENWTKPSVATTLSSLYPTTHDTKKDESALPADVKIIPQHLQEHGFATAGFIANGYISDKFGFKKGWDTYLNYIRDSKPSEAQYVYADALNWLQNRPADKPFFLYIQTIDPHVNYRADEQYVKRYFDGQYSGPLGPTIDADELAGLSSGKIKASPQDVAWVRALYNAEVTYHDEEMGKFLDRVNEMGLWNDTMLVITNDHGEEGNDHGKFGHGHSLYEELLRAPLLMYFPGIFPAGEHVAEIVENVDVAPTILDALGIEPMKGVEGLSLLPLIEGKPAQRPYYAVSEFLDGRRSVRVGNYKLMRSSSTWVNLFDVVNDPGEQKNLADDHLIALRMAEIHMGEGLAMPDKSKRHSDITERRRFTASKAQMDPETRKQLEALGYFADGQKDVEEGNNE